MPKASAAQENGEQALPEEITINFRAKPVESRRQLEKLIKVVSEFVLPRADIVALYRQLIPIESHQFALDEDSNLNKMLGQVATESSVAVEKAKILSTVFGKKTSVVFDAQAICDLFQKQDQTDEFKELLANLLFTQLVLVKNNMAQAVNSRFIFQKYWDLNQSVMSLNKLNEMIQSNRSNVQIVEPLLKTISVLAKNRVEFMSSESAGDILDLLTKEITTVSASDAHKTLYL